MAEMTSYKPGTFSWTDLGTTDAAGAKKFYTELFGWTAVDMPAGDAGIYSMLHSNDKLVAALYEQSDEQKAQGIPPAWLSYVTVANAEESAEKAKALGGTVMMGPFDVMTAGKMALIQGPTGAVFAVWEPKDQIGAHLVNEPVSLVWNELATRDVEAAKAFYTGLFGWTTEEMPMPDFTYTTWVNDGNMNGGMIPMTGPQWEGIPAHWGVFFAVADTDAIAEKAKSLGGAVHVPPTDIPNIGRFAVIGDPQGATFTAMKLINPS